MSTESGYSSLYWGS